MPSTDEAVVLLLLRYQIASTPEDIAAALGFDLPRVQTILDDLEARGVIESA